MKKILLPGVAALLVACGTLEPVGPPIGSAVPLALLGTWHFQVVGDQLCDAFTCVPTFAQSETLVLSGDGRFVIVRYRESNVPPCSQVVRAEGRGLASVLGQTLLLSVQEGMTRVDDTCGESFLLDERGNAWSFGWELFGDVLVLTDDQGARVGPLLRQPGQ